MKLLLHGAGQEVGRSCIELQAQNHTFLFDCGFKITSAGNLYPENVPLNVDAIFLSHAHLDHSGALPYYHFHGLQCPIYTTQMTKMLTQLLLRDSFHVEQLRGHEPVYQKEDITDVMGRMKIVQYNKEKQCNSYTFTFYDAGHIPGSSSIYLTVGDSTVLYSGDIKFVDSLLLEGADMQLPPVDVLILEATYGDRDQKKRSEEIERFRAAVLEVIDTGGSVVVPAFAIGRSQEVLMMLLELPSSIPLYLDGMGKKALRKFLDRSDFVRDSQNLKAAMRRVHFVSSARYRQQVMRDQGVFITSAGMMDGGPVIQYMEYLYSNPKNAVFLTGYQAEGCNGRLLLEQGMIRLDENVVAVQCRVESFQFSAHASMSELHQFILTVKPKIVVLNHGDENSCLTLQQWCTAQGIVCHAPKSGEELVINTNKVK